jgi:hypothetical protein
VALAIAALALAAPAAATALPPNNGGIDQYVAPVPDAGGDRPANPGGGGGGGGTGGDGSGGGGGVSQLPPGVQGSLPAGDEGSLLARIATDPGSGAPSSGGKDGSSGGGTGSGGSGDSDGAGGSERSADEKDVTAASAITSSVSDDPAVAVVILAILGLTLALGAIGLARRRRGT